MDYKNKYLYLAQTIREKYEELYIVLDKFIENERIALSNNEYNNIPINLKSAINAQITRSSTFISLRTRMLMLEDIIDENGLRITKWQWKI